jgi:pentose-5-phosphate-3-epimerase
LKDKPELDVYMPCWEDLNYTADLMCLNPEKYIETLVAYGFDEIIVHFRSLKDLNQLEAILEMCEKYDLKLYLAVDMKSNFSEFMHTVQGVFNSRHPNFVGVQVMGIENIGQQHQDFVPETLEMVKKIKSESPDLKILFDGGITDENLLEIKNAGVDVFCIGHLLTDGDFVDNLRFIKKLLN